MSEGIEFPWYPLEPFDLEQVRTKEIRSVTDNFILAAHKIHKLIFFPAFMVGMSMRYQLARTMLQLEVFQELPGDQKDAVSSAQRGIVNCLNRKDLLTENGIDEFINTASSTFSILADRFDQDEQVRSMWVAMMLFEWTAVEALLLDLLKSCHENYPHLLENQIDSGDIAFQKLAKIRQVYDDTFRNSEITGSLGGQLFEGLSMLRNLFMHRNGIIDLKFLEQCRAGKFVAWSKLAEGTPFPLDAATVSDYLKRSYRQGLGLACAVDRYIASKKGKGNSSVRLL